MSLFAGLVARTNAIAQPLAVAYAAANMTAKVKITRPGGWAFDPETGIEAPAAGVVIYDDIARVWPISGAAVQGMGDEPQYFDTTMISIPLNAAVARIDDVVEITVHKDPRAVGRVFRVTGHETGGQLPAVQRMTATGIAPSKQWTAP